MKVKINLARILISSMLFLSLTACSGSDSSPPVTLTSQSTLDGVVSSNSVAVANGFTSPPFAGDFDSTAQGIGARQFYSFDISSIPSTATVTSATLRLFQAFTMGQPYSQLGNVLVDHLDYGLSLDGTDYNTP